MTINKKSEIINLINLISDFDIDNIYMVVKFESFYYDVPLLGHKLWDWEV